MNNMNNFDKNTNGKMDIYFLYSSAFVEKNRNGVRSMGGIRFPMLNTKSSIKRAGNDIYNTADYTKKAVNAR